MTLQTSFDPFGRAARPAFFPAAGRVLLLPLRAASRRWRNGRDAEWLAELPDYLLADIGIGRADVEAIRCCGAPPGAR
ncbi:Uncharacterized conserved protein YjiS, DUF1127 family [Tistlia consotensis]|uniref:Uncharacterized conserved protein YjiS, DUF1127 family n=1 Tax=Tistlia consotensis USBA 355 TaxID=560819 RepID=A0A1Y6B4A2_9PROT|nr:DUF1127 domain-containing protein [Tistlia consotensis]SME89234.1 Uncharacterized conserved protein YjiS, DUF1127 family [Tistlia consotensis USBA 355]SNR25807.1 Uncharacterized conserved protein YjiS, DUF1127 family [Tistlia consotensis]